MEKGLVACTLQEALEWLDKETFTIYAGGTDLMINKKFSKLLFIHKIPELKEVIISDTTITIGSSVTISAILENPDIPDIIKTVLSYFASKPIRNMATIGGNICNASPAGDSLTFLYLLNTNVELRDKNKIRKLPINEFILGPGKISRKSNELLTYITFDVPAFTNFFYRKVGQRSANSITKCSFLGAVDIRDSVINDLRICFGSVAPVIVRNDSIEKNYLGFTIEKLKSEIDHIISDYESLIKPIDDVRSSAQYRKSVSINLLKHFIKEKI
jgi:xanthine dehydrogenase FAD-binding subunit